jgi:hypothetical protein
MKKLLALLLQQVTQVLIVLFVVAGTVDQVTAETQSRSLQAAQVLPARQLKGANYRIATQVLNDGLVNTYRLDEGSGEG